jgi:hypothetical protein
MAKDDHLSTAKVWTTLGWTLLALFIPYLFYIGGGDNIFGASVSKEALRITMAGWGIVAFGLGFTALAVLGMHYIGTDMDAEGSEIPWPANTRHEAAGSKRDPFLAKIFLAAFVGAPVIATLAGIVRYAGSRISDWNANTYLAEGFFGSRLEAYKLGCARPPCFRIFPTDGHEYILYFTDGVLLFVVLLSIVMGTIWSIKGVRAMKRNTH